MEKVELDLNQKLQKINKIIRYSEKRIKRKSPILRRQDFLGSLIFLLACSSFLINSVLYIKNLIPWWSCVLFNSFYASILHELEHDFIHFLYFRGRPAVQNLFMFWIWLFKGNTVNPWYRRFMHLLHHRHSGQKNDLEERLIGNGMKFSLFRFLVMLDPLWNFLLIKRLSREIKEFKLKQALESTFPVLLIFFTLWYSFILLNSLKFFQIEFFLLKYQTIINTITVCYLLPNLLRHFSLSFISSNCHYYGNIPSKQIAYQTQILDAWYLAPFQLFCFNFGSTHCIHHFVVNQPFYLRQLIAPLAHAAIKKYGEQVVKINDIASFWQKNQHPNLAKV